MSRRFWGALCLQAQQCQRALAQTHRDIKHNIHIAIEERIPGLGDSARMDLRLQNHQGTGSTSDVGFVSAALSALTESVCIFV